MYSKIQSKNKFHGKISAPGKRSERPAGSVHSYVRQIVLPGYIQCPAPSSFLSGRRYGEKQAAHLEAISSLSLHDHRGNKSPTQRSLPVCQRRGAFALRWFARLQCVYDPTISLPKPAPHCGGPAVPRPPCPQQHLGRTHSGSHQHQGTDPCFIASEFRWPAISSTAVWPGESWERSVNN